MCHSAQTARPAYCLSAQQWRIVHGPLTPTDPRWDGPIRAAGASSLGSDTRSPMLKLSTSEALAILLDSRLFKTDERVFAAIAQCKSSRPSRARISGICDVSLPNISRAIKRLVTFGYLRIEECPGQTNRFYKGVALTRITGDTPPVSPKLVGTRITDDTQALRALRQKHRHLSVVR